jgi:curved DNA-binding protein CbpA
LPLFSWGSRPLTKPQGRSKRGRWRAPTVATEVGPPRTLGLSDFESFGGSGISFRVNQASSDKNSPSVELLANVDITKLPLTPEEGFVCSRLLGRRRTLADLANETGFSASDVKRHIESLVRKGAITMVAGSSGGSSSGSVGGAGSNSKASTSPTAPPPYDGMVFSPADLAEGHDLSLDQKRRILFFDANLGTWSHYRLLAVKRSATAADIKSAYFKLSKEFHPDSFFRKNLGRHAERVDRIFRALKAAYDTLSRPELRAAYDETLVPDFTPEELAELAAIADEKKREAQRAAMIARNETARKAARLKWNPIAKKLARGAELFALAEEARKAGRLDEAATQARLACSFDEHLLVRAEAIFAEADAARAQALLKRLQNGLRYQDGTSHEDFVKASDVVAELAEKQRSAPFLLEVAQVMQALKRPQRAFRLANLAVELEPGLLGAWIIVAEAAATEHKWALTQRAAERWQQLDPKDPRPKELLRQARSR